MKLAKMMMIGSMVVVPSLAMGIAQQDPAVPQQQLQQGQAAAQPGAPHEMTGEIVEVREDGFSLRSDDHTMWFTISPENKSAWAAELETGNRVTVMGTPGDSPDRMVASSIVRADTANTSVDTDFDADVNVDDDSVTAELDTDRELDIDTRTDTQIAQNELRTDDDALDTNDDAFDTDDDRDELPRTASSLPALGSLGLLALLGAVAVTVARRV